MAGGDLPAATARRARTSGRVGVAAGLVAMAIIVASDLNPLANAANDPYVVNVVADTSLNDDPTLCDTAATCTLRAAIERANSASGHDRIEFAIPGAGPHTISPVNRLPLLADQAGVTIDGYTQPGTSVNTLDHGTNADIRIQLQGPGPASDVEGFYIRSSDNVIRGLAIFDFDKHIRIYGDDPTTSLDDIAGPVGHNEIIGNFIGTNAAGTHQESALVQNSDGVHLQHGTTSNRIGKPGNEHRNVISGVADRGVGLYNVGTDFNLIQNNIVGLAPDAVGLTPLGNINHGIDVNLGASRNTVGGWNPGEGNVVSANGRTGIEVSHNPDTGFTEENLVIGNLVGTNVDGMASSSALANGEFGIYFEGHDRCAATCEPDIRRNVAAANTVVGSSHLMMISKGAHENVVTGNRFGVLLDDSIAGPRADYGITIQMGAYDNLIEQNTIAGSRRGVHSQPIDSRCEGGDTECEAAVFPVYGNTFTRNSIYDTEVLGIELRTESTITPGLWVEGPGADSRVNGGISAPTIDVATTDQLTISGCVGACTIEVFVTPDVQSGCFFCTWGRGERFVLDADHTGPGPVVVTLRTVETDPMTLLAGSFISATITDAAGNTSEFSERREVTAGTVPPPSPPTTTIATTTTTTISPATSTTSTTTTSVPGGGPVIAGGASASALAQRCELVAAC